MILPNNNNLLLGHLRGASLGLMESLPPLKHWLAAKSMGLGRKQTRLGRGISL